MKIPHATFSCGKCGKEYRSYRPSKGDLVPNSETWQYGRKAIALCFTCSRDSWNQLLAQQKSGVEIELIVHDGIAENGAHTWHAVLKDWQFKDSGGGVWRSTRRPMHYAPKVKFVKVIASNNNQGK